MTEFTLPAGRPALMGILNVTPDSFSDGGQHYGFREAVEWGLRMMDDGADLVDVGGESTRPGAPPVSADEEIRRVVPVVEVLAHRGVPVSIDTMKLAVADAALEAGAVVVNDVSGLRGDDGPRVAELCARHAAALAIMHMQGTPHTMQTSPKYGDVVREVLDFLLAQAKLAEKAGVSRARIWIDPGIGFGKTVQHNLQLLRSLEEFVATGHPVLVGVSRKSFVGKVLGSEAEPLPVDQRLEGTLAAQAWAQTCGVRVIRAHDVKESRRVIDMIAAITPS